MSKPPTSEPPESLSPHGGRPMTALTATGWALGITYAFFVLAVALAKARPGSENDVVSGLLCQAIAYLTGLFVILRVHAPDTGIRDFVGLRPTHVLFYPLAILLGVSLVIPANALYDVVERWSGHKVDDHLAEIFHAAGPGRQALIALVVILFGPMLEEVLFRGALFRPMLKVHPPSMVIVVTATLFAIAHPAWQLYLPIGVVGLALGVLRRESGSLAPGVVLHATFNAVSFYSMAARWDWTPPAWTVPASCVVGLALLAAIRRLGDRSIEAAIAQEFDRQ